jgi:hypothetical protein
MEEVIAMVVVEEADTALSVGVIGTVTALGVEIVAMEDPMEEKVVQTAIEIAEAVTVMQEATVMAVSEGLHAMKEAPEIGQVLTIGPVEAHVLMTIVIDKKAYIAGTAYSLLSFL